MTSRHSETKKLSLSKKIVKVIPQSIKLNWMEPYKNELSVSGKASGFFIDNQGHILTCAHVVINAKMVLVEIPSLGQEKFQVEILGVCPKLDLALLRLKPNRVYEAWGGSWDGEGRDSWDGEGRDSWDGEGRDSWDGEGRDSGNQLSEILKKRIKSLGGPLEKYSSPQLQKNGPSFKQPNEFLTLGDSNQVQQGDDVYAVGFPMGQHNLKITRGTINGRQKGLFQIDAPLNPGNSGGPLLNKAGLVVGVNNSGIMRSNNIGYAIPIANFRLIEKELRNSQQSLVYRPFFGFDFHTSTPSLHKLKKSNLSRECRSGIAIKKIYARSPISHTGLQSGDLLCAINGIKLDDWGLLEKTWFDEKMSLGDLMKTLRNNEEVTITYWQNQQKQVQREKFKFYPFELAIRRAFPMYEEIDSVVFGGFVVMNLTLNHLEYFAQEGASYASRKLMKYLEAENREDPILIITYIFPNSYVSQLNILEVGDVITKVNRQPVQTVAEYRTAMTEPIRENGQNYLVIETQEQTEVALDFEEALKAERVLADIFKYTLFSRALPKGQSRE